MGTYVNPGNSGFAEINDEDYVDKTMLIDLVNPYLQDCGVSGLNRQRQTEIIRYEKIQYDGSLHSI